jgi:hypothetical protein
MSFIKTGTALLSAASAAVLISILGADKANALSEIGLPENFVIENANNRSMVVDKFGDDPNTSAKAHLYTKTDSRTYTLRGIRSSNGSYEVKSVYNGNLCFTMAGGLNPNQGNGTLAVFSGDCNNSLNLRFYDDGTIRVARNTNLCLTNQGNRYNTPLNKLHFWACDGSAETKWNVAGAGAIPPAYNPPVVQSNPIPKPIIKNYIYVVSENNIREVNFKYTAVLITARAGYDKTQYPQVGHSVFVMVKNWTKNNWRQYNNGKLELVSSTPLEEITTISSPGPESKADFNSVRIDNGGRDKDLFDTWKSAGNSPRKNGISFRTLSVSEESYKRSVPKSKGGYNTSYRTLGCALYDPSAIFGCNCTTVSTSMFNVATGESYYGYWNPTELAQKIDQKNQLGDWVDGGVGLSNVVKFK